MVVPANPEYQSVSVGWDMLVIIVNVSRTTVEADKKRVSNSSNKADKKQYNRLSFDAFFLFIGREHTTRPANNCLQKSVLLQIIFCSGVIETTLLCEGGKSVAVRD